MLCDIISLSVCRNCCCCFFVVFVIYFIIYYMNLSQKLYRAAEQPYNQKVNQELILNLVQSLEFTSHYDWKYIARWPPAHINHV